MVLLQTHVFDYLINLNKMQNFDGNVCMVKFFLNLRSGCYQW